MKRSSLMMILTMMRSSKMKSEKKSEMMSYWNLHFFLGDAEAQVNQDSNFPTRTS
jgi:hypothetical protein